MAKYDNSGALFKNDKQGNENWADYRGSITVNGVEYWLSAWLKDGEKGKFLSLAVKPKDGNQPQQKQRPRAPQNTDDIPF